MHRLLIADPSHALADAVVKVLGSEYHIETCADGRSVVALLERFQPDILVMDAMLPVVDCFSVLRAVSSSGCDTKVIVLSSCCEEYILLRLASFGVSDVLSKPCAVSALVSRIREISFCLRYPDPAYWCAESETEQILLSLAFRVGPVRFHYLVEAILYRYHNPDSVITKEIYPSIARKYGGSVQQVEKALRDGIKDAWSNGDALLWALYFPRQKGEALRHPTNEEFVARIAVSLTQKSRIKRPYFSKAQ